MQIALVCSRRHDKRRGEGQMEGKKREAEEWRGRMEAWGASGGGGGGGRGWAWRREETPKGSGSILVSEVEGGCGSCLGKLRSTAQRRGLKTFLSVLASQNGPQRLCLRGLQWPVLIFLYVCVCVCACMGKRKCGYIHCTYCFPCSQAAPGTSVCVCEGR